MDWMIHVQLSPSYDVPRKSYSLKQYYGKQTYGGFLSSSSEQAFCFDGRLAEG